MGTLERGNLNASEPDSKRDSFEWFDANRVNISYDKPEAKMTEPFIYQAAKDEKILSKIKVNSPKLKKSLAETMNEFPGHWDSDTIDVRTNSDGNFWRLVWNWEHLAHGEVSDETSVRNDLNRLLNVIKESKALDDFSS